MADLPSKKRVTITVEELDGTKPIQVTVYAANVADKRDWAPMTPRPLTARSVGMARWTITLTDFEPNEHGHIMRIEEPQPPTTGEGQ